MQEEIKYYAVLVEGVNHGTYLPHLHARTADALRKSASTPLVPVVTEKLPTYR
jgi:hypothetical protein